MMWKKFVFYLFFSFYFDTNLKTNSSWHTWFVWTFFQIIPHIHLTRQSTHFNYSLSKEIVRFSCQFLSQFRLQIIIFIPNSDFNTIRGVVTFTIIRNCFCKCFNSTLWNIFRLKKPNRLCFYLQVELFIPIRI